MGATNSVKSTMDGWSGLHATFAVGPDGGVARRRDSAGRCALEGVAVRNLPKLAGFAAVLAKGEPGGHPTAWTGEQAWHPGAFSAPRLFAGATRVILDSDDEDTTPRRRYFTAAPALLWNGRRSMR